MYPCVFGHGMWEGRLSLETEGMTDTQFSRVTHTGNSGNTISEVCTAASKAVVIDVSLAG